MSEHEWDVFVFLLSLSLSFSVCVCFWGSMSGEIEFPEDSFNWEQSFWEKEKEQQKQLGKRMKADRHLRVLSVSDDEYFCKSLCPCASVLICFALGWVYSSAVNSRLPKLWFTVVEIPILERKSAEMDVEIPPEFSRMAQFPYSTLHAAYIRYVGITQAS